ncbi:hypothetical protein Pelo_11713 [Pelomyxa schiedti]|nr:hypothetical protein Pelo_11713 [Pelomyxa schiedti]
MSVRRTEPEPEQLPAVAASCSVNAVDQFAALAASSHPRCGSRSPARSVLSVPALARLIWLDWVLGTASSVALAVQPRTVLFGVSRATLGLTPRGRVSTLEWRWWLAPGVSARRDVGYVTTLTLRRDDDVDLSETGRGTGTGRGTAGSVQLCRAYVLCDAVNARWWVTCGRENSPGTGTGSGGGGSKRVTMEVSCILEFTSYRNAPGRIVPAAGIEVPWMPGEGVTSTRLFLNNVVPDEALFIFCCDSSKAISCTLFDVRQTYESKRISVLAQSPLVSVPFKLPVSQALVFRRKRTRGSVVFIVMPWGNDDDKVFQVDSRTGLTKLLSTRCSDLSQLNDCIFCVGKAFDYKMSYELWDCHNSDHPVRCIQTTDHFLQVIAGCGFLFAVSESDRKIHVIDASSGLPVITFDMFAPTLPKTQFLTGLIFGGRSCAGAASNTWSLTAAVLALHPCDGTFRKREKNEAELDQEKWHLVILNDSGRNVSG